MYFAGMGVRGRRRVTIGKEYELGPQNPVYRVSIIACFATFSSLLLFFLPTSHHLLLDSKDHL
jgi:hypothetical protein